jgi:hypothetical protein
MKLSFLIGAATGYVLGARAGRARYESIVGMARAAWTSNSAQTVTGAAQAQADQLATKVRHTVGRMLTHDAPDKNTTTIQYANPSHPVGLPPTTPTI